MRQEWWVPTFLTIWGVVAPFIGLVVGHYMSVSRERRHWIATNKREEYRELVSAMVQTVNIVLENQQLDRQITSKEVSQEEEAVKNLLAILNTRLFIRDFIKENKLRERWDIAYEEPNLGAFRDKMKDMIESVVQEATTLGK